MAAEIEQKGGGKKGGKKRSKKMSTKVDFTPMVDLGFLLITFFMLTTSMTRPKTLDIPMPEKDKVEDDPSKVADTSALTVILTEKDKIYYYAGLAYDTMSMTDFSTNGIRKVLLEKNDYQLRKLNNARAQLRSGAIDTTAYKKQVNEIKGDKGALMVMVKSDDKARFENLIDILDEILITRVSKYAILDLEDKEQQVIKEIEEGTRPLF